MEDKVLSIVIEYKQGKSAWERRVKKGTIDGKLATIQDAINLVLRTTEPLVNAQKTSA